MSAGWCLPSSSAIPAESRRSFHILLVFNLMVMFNLADRGDALRLTNMSSPAVADLRDELTLDCKFDMGEEQLYAVKWYKDDREFFRYMPYRKPSTLAFPVAGVHIVPSGIDCAQDHCNLRLHNLTRDHSGGAYLCEISAGAPTFRLASETHNVTIAALPRGNLRIEGLVLDYSEGDVVIAACLSDPADPAPILSWYMNGQQAPHKFVGDMTSSQPDSQGLVSRSLSLRFAAERKYFHGDRLELLCKSSLPGIPVPPQTTRRTLSLRSQPSQVINNQKLHWLSGTAASWRRSGPLQIVLVTAVRWLLYLFQNVR